MCSVIAGDPTMGLSEIIPEVAFRAEASTGEGSIWHPDRKTLFWVDIEGKTLYEYCPRKQDCKTWLVNRMISAVVPETSRSVVVALQDEIVRIHTDSGVQESIAPIEVGDGIRCNDGKCDPAGRFWIGTIAKKAPKGSAALYMVLHDGTVTTKITGVTNSNGIIWSPDKKFMYYTDTPTRQIVRYRYDVENAEIVWDGIAVAIPEHLGRPDGMTIDKEGLLWVAQWNGYGVYCYNPDNGKLLRVIQMPVPNVTSCAFGGEQLDELYITTARSGLTPEELKEYPLSGSLFICKPGAIGMEANRFSK